LLVVCCVVLEAGVGLLSGDTVDGVDRIVVTTCEPFSVMVDVTWTADPALGVSGAGVGLGLPASVYWTSAFSK
jgi:hypothetical protein